MSKKKFPTVQSIEKFKRRNTKELLGYLQRLRKCEESFELSDMDINPDLQGTEIIYFKDTDKWKTAYQNVKLILNERKHIK